jgi:hypothetical protein
MEPLFAFQIRIKAPKRILLKVAYLASLFLVGEISPKNKHALSLSLSLSAILDMVSSVGFKQNSNI